MRRCYYCNAKILDGEFVCEDCAEALENRLKGVKRNECKRNIKRRTSGDLESYDGDGTMSEP